MVARWTNDPHNGICFTCDDDPNAPADDEEEKEEAAAAADDETSCACTDGPALTLKRPVHSNLGGQGPDLEAPEEILYPEAGVIDGQVVGVRIWTADSYAGKSAKNGVTGSLGRLSMKTDQRVTFKLALVNGAGDNLKVDSLGITFLDLDEGKKAKGRVAVTACGAEQFTPEGTELTLTHDGQCSSATSSTKGNGKDNPSSVEGGLADAVASKRIVSYIFQASEDNIYTFSFSVTPGFGVRNFLFSLTPGAACIDESNMPDGCSAALQAEALDITTPAPAPEEEAPPVDPTTTPAPEEEVFDFVVADKQNTCPEGSSEIKDAAACEAAAPNIKWPGQRNGRWENRGSNFGFMPYGCVLYTGWKSGMHESIVLWNNNKNGRNDGNRAKVCAPFPAEREEEEKEQEEAEEAEFFVGTGNECPEGSFDLKDAAACEAAAPNIQWPGQRDGRWENRGSNFGFMPYGCVLYTGWKSGMHESIVLWNNNKNGRNDGNRAKICSGVPAEEEEEVEQPAPEELIVANRENTCPSGSFDIKDAAACEAAAPNIKFPGQRDGRWENRGSNFGFMPYGCVLYTGWKSGMHESIVLWNNNKNGRNDGNRAKVCTAGPAEEIPAAEKIDYVIANGKNACPAGSSPIADAAACEAAAPSLQYGNQRPGRWQNRGNNFGFMPPGCVLYTGWPSGQHEAIVLWNNNQNGRNDGNRAVICQPGGDAEEELEALPEPYIGVGANTCPPGKSPIADAAACEEIAPRLKYGNQRHGRWQNRGSSFGFMPPGCVLYTGWPSGQHEAIVLWNNNQNGRNDGHRAVVCQ
jgi:hypothetical protein